MYPMR